MQKQSTFSDLHKAIQVACGWKNSHLYSFSKQNPANTYGPDRSVFAVSPHDDPAGYDIEPDYAELVPLSAIFDDNHNHQIYYVYDYGDGWIHSVKRLALHHDTETFKRRLLAGARAFPLEDSGGLPGYQRCVDAYQNKLRADKNLLHWMGKWSPEIFDLIKTQNKFDLPKRKNSTKQREIQQTRQPLNQKPNTVHYATNLIDLTEWSQRSGLKSPK